METNLLFILLNALAEHDREKAETEKRLYKLAFEDRLTGLGNERKMLSDLRTSLQARPEQALTIVSLDITNLKQINQVMGFDYGTSLLCSLAEELKLRLEPGESCYRIGGDVFSLLWLSQGVDEDNLRLEELLLSTSMSYSFTHNHKLLFAAGAYRIDLQELGLLGRSEPGKINLTDSRLEEMYSFAELARTRSKQPGSNSLSFFTQQTLDELARERELEEGMKPAMERGEFVMYFQPKYTCSLQEPRLYGAEALVRWQHPQKGLLSPGRFIPLFEREGKSPVMDEHIMDLVCRQVADWLKQGLEPVPVSVNVSRQTLLQGEKFLRELEQTLEQYHVPRKYIEIEVLESGSAENENIMANFLQQLHSLGFRIDMDDFGSGYSSLGALAHMPIDCLKLDKSFFDDWSENMNKKDAAIVRSIINMAHDIDMTVVAEGIEQKFQLELLEEFGADVIQGFYFSKPLPVAEFTQRLQAVQAGGGRA